MPLIWKKEGDHWRALNAAGFADERALHDLIEEAPHTLPLSGHPELVVVGREVRLGAGFADLIAVERSGRIVVIEIKLAQNSEARRSVVSQVLSYASELHGLSFYDFDALLKVHLERAGHTGLVQALEATDQEGSFKRSDFEQAVSANLLAGNFRLVIVLDGAPSELIRIAGYLQSVAGQLVVDVIVVSSYRVGESTVIVPERVEQDRTPKDRAPKEPSGDAATASARGTLSEGSDIFEASIDAAVEAERQRLHTLLGWARRLESEGLVKLFTYAGVNHRWTLLPRIVRENAGLVTVWNEPGACIQFWRSVFERTAPAFIAKVEAKIGGRIGQGNTFYEFDGELLELLLGAYRVAKNNV